MQLVGSFSGQGIAAAVHLSLGVDGDIRCVRAQSDQSYHRPVGIFGAKIANGVSIVDPLSHLPGILCGLFGQLALELQQHHFPAQRPAQTKQAFIEGLSRPYMERCEPAEQRGIFWGGRVQHHQIIRRVKKFFRSHCQNFVHRNKVIFRYIAALRRYITARYIHR